MCDETTERENAKQARRWKLTRREVSAGASAFAASWWTACTPSAVQEGGTPGSAPGASAAPHSASVDPRAAANETAANGTAANGTAANSAASAMGTPPAAALDITSRAVIIPTPDGEAEGLLVAPRSGKHPGVLMWPDVAGLRPAFERMAARLAGDGFTVLVVNPYYRSAKLPVLDTFSEWQTESGKEKIRPLREELTAERVASDGATFTGWLLQQPEVDTAKQLGTAGYCMSGPFTFRTAAAAPNRVGALASFHGGGLVTAEPNSPHRLLEKIDAAILVCIAQNDDQRDPDAKVQLRAAAHAANVPAEIEVYPAQHGFCVVDSPVYSEPGAERAWARMLDLFRRHL